MEDIVRNWKTNALFQKKETLTFFEDLSSKDKQRLSENLADIHKEAFQKIDCLACANCCRTTPAMIVSTDIKRIASHLKISAKLFKKKYILEDYNGEMTLNGVPCHFLNTDNTCAIYEVRPEACRQYPHTDDNNYFRRPKLNTENTVVCPAAFYIVQKLKSIPL